MITRIQALGFRSSRYLHEQIKSAPSDTGCCGELKLTFPEVPSYLADLVFLGATAATRKRAEDPRDLIWRRGDRLELAIEAQVPSSLCAGRRSFLRYEVVLEIRNDRGAIVVAHERIALLQRPFPVTERSAEECVPATLLCGPDTEEEVLVRTRDGICQQRRERSDALSRSPCVFRIGRKKSALGVLPDDPDSMPATCWFRRYLSGFTAPETGTRKARPRLVR